jgi:hypothetical protein
MGVWAVARRKIRPSKTTRRQRAPRQRLYLAEPTKSRRGRSGHGSEDQSRRALFVEPRPAPGSPEIETPGRRTRSGVLMRRLLCRHWAAETDSNAQERTTNNRPGMSEPAQGRASRLATCAANALSDAALGRAANVLLSHQAGVRIPVAVPAPAGQGLQRLRPSH